MDKNLIIETLFYIQGNIPIIYTIMHDGVLYSLGGEELPVIRGKRENDSETRNLALRISALSKKEAHPHFLFEEIDRIHLSKEIKNYFFEQVLLIARECLINYNRCLLIDIHAFKKQPKCGNYHIIFGTDHRNTIKGDIDIELAKTLSIIFKTLSHGSELSIFVPERTPAGTKKDNERFGATCDFTLANWITKQEPRINAIQVEISNELLKQGECVDFLGQVFEIANSMILKY